MCYNVKKMCRKSSPLGEGKGEGPLTHRTPPAYREHRAFQLSLGVMYVREESSCDDK